MQKNIFHILDIIRFTVLLRFESTTSSAADSISILFIEILAFLWFEIIIYSPEKSILFARGPIRQTGGTRREVLPILYVLWERRKACVCTTMASTQLSNMI